ncbi:PDZ domain-containing protein [Shewanella sp. 202IG2-18]|uniref:PDZ domain-containing protein n=1 Tax=Parashewanella hymeniacidonis TaxID=2807618 RepID=UPI001960EFD0|nr:PDZ domain-containing protein [Parashewanella hymeniacidonis]MBM7070671.1 PDZ domain-containing protein [Parashewanella hymeniacidonis]
MKKAAFVCNMKKEWIKVITLLITPLFLVSCAQSGYKQFYHSYVDIKAIPDVELISKGEMPKILSSNNLTRDTLILRSKRYIPIGYSSFNGVYEDTSNAAKQALIVGATVVLVNAQYTNTQATTNTLLIPSNTTTNHYGSISSGTITGTYTETSTTHDTQIIPITTHQRRYDQEAIYFVKSNFKPKFGISLRDLTPKQRTTLGRNTGLLVEIVVEDSPAFNSNVLVNDVLISIDGVNVKNVSHAVKLLREVPPSQIYSVLRVIRKGEEQDVKVTL